MEFEKLSLIELCDGIKSQKYTSKEVVEYFVKRCEEKKDLKAVIEVFNDAIYCAEKIDEKIKRGEKVGVLAGVPIAIKDNILYNGKKMGCASKFMQDFVAPYSSTVVEKLLKEGAVIIGRTNMDEFAMGGSCENTCYGSCHNAIDFDCVAGGSSGGSAVAVAAGLVPCAIGTDTGGSIRQPASFNGVVGIKSTYGRVSRYGIVAFASSLDQACPITKTIDDCELVLSVIEGRDIHDGTTISGTMKEDYKPKDKRLTLGICKQIIEKLSEIEGAKEGYRKYKLAVEKLKDTFDIVEVDIPHITSSLACYYIIAPAEATSNLARFDGVKYTRRAEGTKDLESVYVQSRSEGFGREVQRRIVLGNFVLSSGYFDAYYNKAKKVQRLLRREFKKAFESCDALIMPTTIGTAFKIGEKLDDPISMYMEDLFTVPANIAGIPAISIPYAKGENGLPLGMQFMADERGEEVLFEVGKKFQETLGGKLL